MNKTLQLLAYITKNHCRPSVTSLVKLSYLVDLINVQKNGIQISDFSYIRYYYGPYDEKIVTYLQELVDKQVLKTDLDFSSSGEEYIVYFFNEKNEFSFPDLTEEDKKIVDQVLDNLKGYGAKTLTEIAYKTRPMKALQATLGGNEHLGEKLDLTIK
jgi:hypothetical protein